MTFHYDIAVIGGGVAGGAAATWLARRGFSVVLLEREHEKRHKVCGEFLSGESAPLLADLGVDLASLGAHRIHAYRLHGPRETVEGELPMLASGLSRLALDRALLDKAAEAGADVQTGVMVTDARLDGGPDGRPSDGDGITLSLGAGAGAAKPPARPELRVRQVVLATGKYDFKSLNPRPGRDRGMVGFKVHAKLAAPSESELRGHCDLFVFSHGYGGIAMVEGNAANLCILVDKKALRGIGSDWPSLIRHIESDCPRVARYLEGAELLSKTSVTVANIPYGFVRSAPPPPDVFCIGDQMAVIPSLTGDGMTIALLSAWHAVEHICAGEISEVYQKEMRSMLLPKVGLGYQVHRLFRNPRLCDWTIRAVRNFPSLARRFILATRCPAGALPRIETSSAGNAW